MDAEGHVVQSTVGSEPPLGTSEDEGVVEWLLVLVFVLSVAVV